MAAEPKREQESDARPEKKQKIDIDAYNKQCFDAVAKMRDDLAVMFELLSAPPSIENGLRLLELRTSIGETTKTYKTGRDAIAIWFEELTDAMNKMIVAQRAECFKQLFSTE
jgi:hypothetical protein